MARDYTFFEAAGRDRVRQSQACTVLIHGVEKFAMHYPMVAIVGAVVASAFRAELYATSWVGFNSGRESLQQSVFDRLTRIRGAQTRLLEKSLTHRSRCGPAGRSAVTRSRGALHNCL